MGSSEPSGRRTAVRSPPSLVGDLLRHFDSLVPKLGQRDLDVITHQIELVPVFPVSGMDSNLSRRQSKNKPASTRVH